MRTRRVGYTDRIAEQKAQQKEWIEQQKREHKEAVKNEQEEDG